MKSEIYKKSKLKEGIFSVIIGVFTGLVNGLFGGGGGMLVVPFLTGILKLEPKFAHATAILIILPISLASGIFYAYFGNFSLNVGVPTAIGVIAGGIIGALLLSKISSKWLVIIFSFVMALAGVKMLVF